jgi:peroxiredoxin
MNVLRHLFPLLCLLVFSEAQASPAEAQTIQKNYQLAMDRWAQELRIATTAEERTKIWNDRPNVVIYAKNMWALIGSSLDQDWTLGPAAWFLRTTGALFATDAEGTGKLVFSKENDAIRQAVEADHLKNPKLIPMCFALAASPNPRSLAILEKIQNTHPDPKTQGVAALGAALQLRSLGDDAEIMRKRLTYLRKAIIQSSDVEYEGTTVAKIAEDELHVIRYLTKGRIAPDLVGVDSANRPLSLEANKGKIIILLFWNSNMQDFKQVTDITNNLVAKFRDRPLVVLGVNSDPTATLRSLESNDTVTWQSFSDPENKLAKDFRISNWPTVIVLDGQRKIHYSGAPGSFAELTADALLSESKPTVPAE